MDVERVTAVLRPRGQWEAIDFGLALARHWRRPLWTAWFAVVAPVWWLLYGLLTATAGPWIALLTLWWLRPLFSRVPLLVLSRALFGEVLTPRRAAREATRLWRRNLAGDLTIRRFDLARAFHLPVYQLEGLTGRARRRRLAVLRQDRHAAAAAATAIAMLVEASLFFAAITLATQLVPAGFGIDWGEHLASLFRGEAATWFVALVGLCAFLAFTIGEPFYVAGGFGLYLDRRIHLEGWDVELALRRLSRRLVAGEERQGSGSGIDRRTTAALLAVLVLAAGGAVAAQPSPGEKSAQMFDKARAAIGRAPAPAPRDPATVVTEVLADPAFSTRRQVEGWRLKEGLLDRFDRLDRPQPTPISWPIGLLARSGEVVLWIVAIGLLTVLVAAVVRSAGLGPRWRRAGRAHPEVRSGLDPGAEELPADPATAADELFAAGRATEALGLLYRSALARLGRRREVAPGWTEEECVLRLAGQLETGAAGWFRHLAASWQAAAYGHREPDAESFVELCEGWRRTFEIRRSETVA